MTISLQSIPEELKSNKDVTPYIVRSLELNEINPVISYYCKVYVLEFILSNKLHSGSKSIESFTIELLDDTEKLKADNEVLQNKQLSITAVLSFGYRLFNQCLEELGNLTRENKPNLIKKFKACINFLNLLTIFQNSDEIDWVKISKVESWVEFDKLNKEKIKVLKYNLSKLIKDEIPYKEDKTEEEINVDDEELEKELDQELNDLQIDKKENETEEVNQTEIEHMDTTDDALNLPGAPNDLPKFLEEDEEEEKEVKSNDEQPVLPGAPHFSPQVSDDEEMEFKLPGAPKYLPNDDDDELSHINKTSSIHVYQPSSPTTSKPNLSRNALTSSQSQSHTRPSHHHQLSKNDIKQILDKEDLINLIKKNIKFANSALTFDDLNECEKQLEDAIKLIKALKKQEGEI